jgi:hypothetical protein
MIFSQQIEWVVNAQRGLIGDNAVGEMLHFRARGK